MWEWLLVTNPVCHPVLQLFGALQHLSANYFYFTTNVMLLLTLVTRECAINLQLGLNYIRVIKEELITFFKKFYSLIRFFFFHLVKVRQLNPHETSYVLRADIFSPKSTSSPQSLHNYEYPPAIRSSDIMKHRSAKQMGLYILSSFLGAIFCMRHAHTVCLRFCSV